MALEIRILRCNLRYWRQKAGYTQDELARLAGVSSGTRISEYERLEKTMSLNTALKLVYVCRCKLDDLYDYEIIRRR